MIFYPFEGAYPSSAFGTATPSYTDGAMWYSSEAVFLLIVKHINSAKSNSYSLHKADLNS